MHRQPAELADCDFFQAVVRCDQYQFRRRAGAGQAHGDPRTQAAPNHRDLRVVGVNLVEQGHGIAGDGFFGGRTAAAAKASVMHEIQGMVREGFGVPRQAA
ncbi:hypothetical protein D3C87_1856350 [compost metagenome]